MNDKILIPLSIIVAGALIGGGIYLKSRVPSSSSKVAIQEAVTQSKNIKNVSPDDHILGNPKARVVVVEYSDPECPFCKEFHKTMRNILSTYGTDGQVAWVYRHFYKVGDFQLHDKSVKEATALECAGSIGGNGKFWEYTNRLYDVTPSNNGLDLSSLTEIAKQVGISSADFNTCLQNDKFVSKIEANNKDANDAGGEGTPYSVIIDTKTGDTYPVPGAQPYASLKGIIDLILGS